MNTLTKVGSARVAQRIVVCSGLSFWMWSEREQCEIYSPEPWMANMIPSGFTPLGEGSTRSAWLHKKTGIVYKTNTHPTRDENQTEWWKYEEMKDKFDWPGWRLPNLQLHYVMHNGERQSVMAMEFVPNDFLSAYNDAYLDGACEYLHRWFDIKDTHSDNVRIDDNGECVLIDFSR